MKKIIWVTLLMIFVTAAFARDRPPNGLYFPATDILIEGDSCEVVSQQIALEFGEDQLHYTYPVELKVKYTIKSAEDEKLKLMLPYVDFFDSEHNPMIYFDNSLVDYQIVPIYITGRFSDGHSARVEMGDNHCVFTYMLYKYYKRSNPVAAADISEEMNRFYSVYDKNGLDSFYTDYLEYMSRYSSEKDLYSMRHLRHNTYIGKFAVFEMLLPANTEMDLIVSYQTKCSFYDAFGWEDNTVYYFSYLFQDNYILKEDLVIDLHTPSDAQYLISSSIPFDLVEEQHYQAKTRFSGNLEIAVFHKNYIPDTLVGVLNILLRSPIFFSLIMAIIIITFIVKTK